MPAAPASHAPAQRRPIRATRVLADHGPRPAAGRASNQYSARGSPSPALVAPPSCSPDWVCRPVRWAGAQQLQVVGEQADHVHDGMVPGLVDGHRQPAGVGGAQRLPGGAAGDDHRVAVDDFAHGGPWAGTRHELCWAPRPMVNKKRAPARGPVLAAVVLTDHSLADSTWRHAAVTGGGSRAGRYAGRTRIAVRA